MGEKQDSELAGLPEEGHGVTPALASVVPVVGIGASAGGLEIFKGLLGNLPSDTGFAFVVVQHLDPDRRSMLPGILAQATAMPVAEAVDGMPIEANHVYLTPSGLNLTVGNGTLQLAPRARTPGMHMPIDIFLRSVAGQCGSRGIGIVLPGTAPDGSAGVEAIKAAGGMTFAQEPAATDCVDAVLPPEEIAAELVRIARHPYIADPLREHRERMADGDETEFGAILALLQAATGVDFLVYRQKMVKRRILRRLALHNIKGLAEYRERLKNDPDELMALQRDLLIAVTSFFRDPETFESLKQIAFPRIFQPARPANDTVRVWVAACATGEEAFSIAILLQEYISETGVAFPVRIFASDISARAIEKARAGKYPESIAEDLTPERLNRYFTKIENGYQICKSVREMCVFTRHNLIEDPPFSKLDLIACRNVLIYLGSVQKNIFPLFHYALKPGGFLMLGASESEASADWFSVAGREHRIFSRRETARKHPLFPGRAVTPGGAPAPSRNPWDGADMRKEVDRVLLSRYSLASVLVDDDLDVIEIRGKANRYLTLPLGKLSFNLIKLISDTGLFIEVEKLIQQAQKNGEPMRQERVTCDDGNAGGLNVEAVPLGAGNKRHTLILFEPARLAPKRANPGRLKPSPPEEDARDRQIRMLKKQLAEAKERFFAAIEEHQSSREESRNTTEDALSTNEELQSLNEELETAKEELQSTNEELITVNDELHVKNAALAQARDFAMSIVETVSQPLLLLDEEWRVRMANRAFYRTFQTAPLEAEGQSVFSLSGGGWDIPGLRNLLDGLIRDRKSLPDFEVERHFPGLGTRNLVLGGCYIDHLKAILLAIDDVTDRKLAQKALRRSEEHLRQSQKMEAIGRLAGGIAHDFNNLLTAIVGYSSLLYDELAGNEAAKQQAFEIKLAGEKAASLTRQLLAFSRRQVLQPKVLDLTAIVEDFDRMLRRLVGERIEVILECEPSLWQVRADPGEIGRAIMNLSLNARDAMPDGGVLTIKTVNMTLTEPDATIVELAPGRYVAMSVRDTGVGMDDALRAHIFEPFFTTKEIGKGTGLGLATVLGIVEQSGGSVRCDSVPDRGTEFTIVLPAVSAAVDAETLAAGGLAGAPGGSEVILLVEDEDVVRALVRQILETSGYVVLEARNGREGLALCDSHKGPIDLLVTDVVMPETGGRDLAAGVLKLRPAMKVMYMSGHTEDVVLKEGILRGAAFLQKPFTPAGLARKVRESLDCRAASAGQV